MKHLRVIVTWAVTLGLLAFLFWRTPVAEVEIAAGREQAGRARRREVEEAARAKGLALLARQAAGPAR